MNTILLNYKLLIMRYLITIFLVLASAAAVSARDTTSTVTGSKLNFEAPVFGVTLKNLKPQWSVVTLGEAAIGVSRALQSPSELKPVGFYAELSLLDFRYRPWRDSNVFSIGFAAGADMRWTDSGLRYEGYGFAPVPTDWSKASSSMNEIYMMFPLAFLREAGDWKFSVAVVPHLGCTVLSNTYITDDGARHADNVSDRFGFRLGFRAAIWYKDAGIAVQYRLKSPHPSLPFPYYDTMTISFSLRY